jgi:hypothetical protein
MLNSKIFRKPGETILMPQPKARLKWLSYKYLPMTLALTIFILLLRDRIKKQTTTQKYLMNASKSKLCEINGYALN